MGVYKEIKTLIRKQISYIHQLIFKRDFEKVLQLIVPHILGIEKHKFGREGDGSYILPGDIIENNGEVTLLSFGISDDISFEKDFHNKYPNISIHAFDPTIPELPEPHNHISFHKIGIAGTDYPDRKLYTINSIIKKLAIDPKSKLIVKMDVEGWEWGFLKQLPDSGLSVDVLTIELHFFAGISHKEVLLRPWKFKKKRKILEDILKKYYIFHIHANNCEYISFNDFEFPTYLELTLITKSVFEDQIIKENMSLHKTPAIPGLKDIQYPFFKYRK